MIEIKASAITVVATGGDHELGGRDWDEQIVNYLAQEVMNETGSSNDPTSSSDSLQELWQKAEQAKITLTQKPQTQIPFFHDGQRVGVTLTREKFDELTAPLLERTITYTRNLLEDARARGHSTFDQLLLVGGSTRMPQVKERLLREFSVEPKIFDPDQAVAKGAAVYGQTLAIGRQIQHKIAEKTGSAPEQVNMDTVSTVLMDQVQKEVARESGYRIGFVKKAQETSITNVASHSFGVVVTDINTRPYTEIISNLVVVNDPLPRALTNTYKTLEPNQQTVELRIMENSTPSDEERNLALGKELGIAELKLPPNLPDRSPIEVTFELNREGRLRMIGREPNTNRVVEIEIQTAEGRSKEELEEMKIRARSVSVS